MAIAGCSTGSAEKKKKSFGKNVQTFMYVILRIPVDSLLRGKIP